VGDDGHGRFVRAFLEQEGVDVRWLKTDHVYRTPLAFCEVFPPDTFPITFYREPTAPDWEITPGDLDVDGIRSVPFVYVSGTGLARSPSRETTFEVLQGHQGTALLDLDWRPALWTDGHEYPALIERAVALADVVVGNEEELRAATGDGEPHRAAEALLRLGPRLVVVKRGAEGAVAFTEAGWWHVLGIESQVVNGLGAGDAFAAALGWGLLRGVPIEHALRDANAAGAFVAGQLACSEAMPTPHQLEYFVQASGSEVGVPK
jgi:5-dehydro-2-deoxygluconokinase